MVVIVLAIFLALVSPLALAPEADALGCYIFPSDSGLFCQEDVTFATAQQDCLENAPEGCNDITTFFVEGQRCNQVPACEEILCNVDCEFQPLALCKVQASQATSNLPSPLQGEQVVDEIRQCGLGCCQIDNPRNANAPTCQMTSTKFSCDVTALQLWGDMSGARFQPGINEEECRAQCGNIAAPQPNEPVQEDQQAGTGVIHGVVRDANAPNAPLESATVFLQGPTSVSIQTDRQGEFSFANLPSGSYTLTATKINRRQAQQQITIVEGQQPDEITLQLEIELNRVVSGVTRKVNPDGTIMPFYGADIFINNIFRAKSLYPDGRFEIRLNPGEHILIARFQDYEYTSEPFIIENQPKVLNDVILTKTASECGVNGATPQKDVEIFNAQHVPGEKKVRLSWSKPCQEVIGYTLKRINPDQTVKAFEVLPATASIFIDDDSTLEWQTAYTYTIVANYPPPIHQSLNPRPTEITLGDKLCEDRYDTQTGWAQFCLANDPSSPENEREIRYTCTDENQVDSTDCSTFNDLENGVRYFCAREGERTASCRSQAQCLASGDPFGLYYTKESCYSTTDDQGEQVPTFCYYDSSSSIVNSCQSCLNIDSCFEYQSKDACVQNNCLGTLCKWVDAASNTQPLLDYANLNIPGLVTPETGAGYCVEENYDKADKCSLCGPTNPSALQSSVLFENYYCTAEVCSALGRCFSNSAQSGNALTSCETCGEKPTDAANCYTYQSPLECTGGQNTQRENGPNLLLSQDQCKWNRCTWLGNQEDGQCVKDGDGDGIGDCDEPNSEDLRGGLRSACKRDITPPITIAESNDQNTPSVSLADHNFTLTITDNENAVGSIYTCINPLQENLPDTCTAFEEFQEHTFTNRKLEQTQQIDIFEHLDLENLPQTQNFKLLFFSKDIYKNQENVQELFFFMDIKKPHFTLKTQIQTPSIQDEENQVNPQNRAATPPKSTLVVHLEDISEPIQCNFELDPLLPQGELITASKPLLETGIETTFENLDAMRYNLTASCLDQYENQFNQSEEFVLDRETRIDIISPQGLFATKQHTFEARTQDLAVCQLHFVTLSNGIPQYQYITDFTASPDGKSHTIPDLDITPYYPGRYHESTNFVISCQDQLAGEEYQDIFSFSIDQIAPVATLFIGEDGEQEEIVANNWERIYFASADIRLTCGTQDHGFPCASLHYCIGPEKDFSCRGADPTTYQTFTTPFKIQNSSTICYYAKDQPNNLPLIIECGTASIDGFGITLENPQPYTYKSEIIGVSSQPEFEWRFSTRLPSTSCRFDFVPDFEYEDIPPVRILQAEGASKYRLDRFPISAGTAAYPQEGGQYDLFVQCEDDHNRISPQKKMTLVYDPSAPQIKEAIALPNPIFEGAKTTFFVRTDDQTICKFDDREGITTFETMRYLFPGAARNEKVLDTHHNVSYPIRFQGLSTTIPLTTICKNGADALSEPQTVPLIIDYAQLGNILRIFPFGEYFNFNTILAEVETSKNALCEYRQDVEYLPFSVTGGKLLHTLPLERLQDGHYQYPIRCTMAGNHVVENLMSFTIDQTAPTITNISDGNITCGQADIAVQVYSQEENLTQYTYEIYDLGQTIIPPTPINNSNSTNNNTNQTGNRGIGINNSSRVNPTLPAPTHILVSNLTIPAINPFNVPLSNLTPYHKYSVRVQATDAALNRGPPFESNGFTITPADYSVCVDDTTPPDIQVAVNSTLCHGATVTLLCPGEDCRNFTYGVSPSNNCVANLSYNGQNVLFTQPGYICYSAQDYVGNSVRSSRQISLIDNDGDGRIDTTQCDRCSQTQAGAIVDMQGCSDEQVDEEQAKTDTDSDQLPDAWEKRFNSQLCLLNAEEQDSDANGISDNLEDYDDDGYTNYQEFVALSDPCIADVIPPNPLEENPEKEEPSIIDDILPEPTQTDSLPLVFMIIGLVMMISSAAFLIYFYKKGGATGSGKVENISRNATSTSSGATAETGLLGGLRSKLQEMRYQSSQRSKERQRAGVFDSFSQNSKQIPHIEKLVGKSATLPALQKVAQTYVDHKDEIKPGLRKEEKDIFNKIEQIAKQTKEKNIGQVVSKQEANDLFGKLQKLAKERKK